MLPWFCYIGGLFEVSTVKISYSSSTIHPPWLEVPYPPVLGENTKISFSMLKMHSGLCHNLGTRLQGFLVRGTCDRIIFISISLQNLVHRLFFGARYLFFEASKAFLRIPKSWDRLDLRALEILRSYCERYSSNHFSIPTSSI